MNVSVPAYLRWKENYLLRRALGISFRYFNTSQDTTFFTGNMFPASINSIIFTIKNPEEQLRVRAMYPPLTGEANGMRGYEKYVTGGRK